MWYDELDRYPVKAVIELRRRKSYEWEFRRARPSEEPHTAAVGWDEPIEAEFADLTSSARISAASVAF